MGRTNSSQQRLLTAAGDLLWEKSYHSVTIDEVCAHAGVMKGSLYHFFDSKSVLALAALQHLWETVAIPAYDQHFSQSNPPLVRITSFLDWMQGLQLRKFRTVGRVLGWPFFTVGCELGGQEPRVSEQLCKIEGLNCSTSNPPSMMLSARRLLNQLSHERRRSRYEQQWRGFWHALAY